jgi:hypothetical protein
VGNFSEGAGLRGGTNHGAIFAIQIQGFVGTTSVTVQGFLRADPLSPCTDLVESSGVVTVLSPYTVILLTAGCGSQKP